jgi:hypothetical protein
VRLESLDISHPAESRAELGVLADELRDAGCEVEVAGENEGTWARLEKSLGGESVDVLNVVLSEAEHLTISAVLITIFNWARKRRFFRDRHDAKATVVFWLDGKPIRTEPLPEPDDDNNSAQGT